MTYPTESIKT